ncbi:signal peptide containing protein [Babesia caballi]|uniref:Signal peptide containing protein n=1 Tax=Babesia caballi TaxID=5871 RepID=A0AAV4M0C6_BABCB|nr:signal peptide containing protein [Babesia caballi]
MMTSAAGLFFVAACRFASHASAAEGPNTADVRLTSFNQLIERSAVPLPIAKVFSLNDGHDARVCILSNVFADHQDLPQQCACSFARLRAIELQCANDPANSVHDCSKNICETCCLLSLSSTYTNEFRHSEHPVKCSIRCLNSPVVSDITEDSQQFLSEYLLKINALYHPEVATVKQPVIVQVKVGPGFRVLPVLQRRVRRHNNLLKGGFIVDVERDEANEVEILEERHERRIETLVFGRKMAVQSAEQLVRAAVDHPTERFIVHRRFATVFFILVTRRFLSQFALSIIVTRRFTEKLLLEGEVLGGQPEGAAGDIGERFKREVPAAVRFVQQIALG